MKGATRFVIFFSPWPARSPQLRLRESSDANEWLAVVGSLSNVKLLIFERQEPMCLVPRL